MSIDGSIDYSLLVYLLLDRSLIGIGGLVDHLNKPLDSLRTSRWHKILAFPTILNVSSNSKDSKTIRWLYSFHSNKD